MWAGEGAAFVVGPAFLGVLGFEGAAQDVFGAGVCVAGKALVDQRRKVGGHVELHGGALVLAS